MFIGKTTLDRNTLIQLQKQLIGSTRTNNTDLVALNYVVDDKSSANELVKRDSPFEGLLFYTFVWVMRPIKFADYQYPGMQYLIDRCKVPKPAYVVWFTAPLNVWFEYVEHCKDEKFVKVIKDQLVKDGYALRLNK